MPKNSIVAYILRSRNRHAILSALQEGKKLSRQLENQTGMYKSHVSRTLRELQNAELARCINPDDRSFRFYGLTEKGKAILKSVDKLSKDLGR